MAEEWNLDECIYNYLVSEADAPKSYHQIYENVSRDGPFQCIALDSLRNPDDKYYRVVIECNGLEDTYKNLHRLYIPTTGRPYLMFSTGAERHNYNNYLEKVQIDKKTDDRGNSEGLMRYLIDNIEDVRNVKLEEYLDGDDNILHMIARYGNARDLEKVLKFYDLDLDKPNRDGRTAIQIAHMNGKVDVVEAFMRAKYGQEIETLLTGNKELRRQNRRLLDETTDNKAMINKLGKDVYQKNINLILAHVGWLFIMILTCYYFVF